MSWSMDIPKRSPNVVCWCMGGSLSRHWKNDYGSITTAQGKAMESLEWNCESREAKDKIDSKRYSWERIRVRGVREGQVVDSSSDFELDNWINADIIPSREYSSGGGLDKGRKNMDKCVDMLRCNASKTSVSGQQSPVHLKMWLKSGRKGLAYGTGNHWNELYSLDVENHRSGWDH